MHHQYAYELKSRRVGDDGIFAPHAIIRCSNCTNILEFAISSQNPQRIAKQVVNKGWEFDVYNRKRALCPTCIRLRNIKRHGEQPGTKVIQMFGKTVPVPDNLVPENKRGPEVINSRYEPHTHHEDTKPEAPNKEYVIRIRTNQKLVNLVSKLEGLGDILSFKVIEQQSTPMTETKNEPQIISKPEPIVKQQTPKSPPIDADKKDTTPVDEKKRQANKLAYKRYKSMVSDVLTMVINDNPNCSIIELANKMNEADLIKPWARAAKIGWNERNLTPFYDELEKKKTEMVVNG